MNLHSFPFLNVTPLPLELLHHFLPNKQTLIVQLLHFGLSLLLELIKPKSSLYYSRFSHKKLQLRIRCVSFIHSPILLNSNCRYLWSLGSFEHSGRNLDYLSDFLLVNNAVEQILIGWLFHIRGSLFCQSHNFFPLYVSSVHIEGGQQFLKQMDNVRN